MTKRMQIGANVKAFFFHLKGGSKNVKKGPHSYFINQSVLGSRTAAGGVWSIS